MATFVAIDSMIYRRFSGVYRMIVLAFVSYTLYPYVNVLVQTRSPVRINPPTSHPPRIWLAIVYDKR